MAQRRNSAGDPYALLNAIPVPRGTMEIKRNKPHLRRFRSKANPKDGVTVSQLSEDTVAFYPIVNGTVRFSEATYQHAPKGTKVKAA